MTGTFNNFDLNLLRIFDAVMQERSVLRASQKLFLSQSAVSHSLRRLRETLDDELFIRTVAGMQPTARALLLADPVRRALASLEVGIGLQKFDPASSNKVFTIAASDSITTVMLPRILKILAAEAPRIDIVVRPSTRIDLAEQLDLGRIDVAVGTFSTAASRFHSDRLFDYDDVLITRAPRTRTVMTMEDFSNLSLMVVSLGGDHEGAVDGYISERGLARRSEMYDRLSYERACAGCAKVSRIAVALPHFMAIPALLDDTQLAAIVPRPLAAVFAQTYPIGTYELPYATKRFEVSSLWHERLTGDGSHDWLHGVIRRATGYLRVD
ncbi:LysR family transcriptional regulator [Luteibacter sp. OK325]|uniref:LysR family transcriptional regulator n=1 Tax=Luteibacter sp. OK325 TaxID=2135670 RepID=UPI000D3A05FC|nr:LysR family transcriptional regulator [Luteibacter sp. OK325]PTR34073.1 LysR family transcriptional regulator [Luteibacter sp. OK325]